MSEDANRLRPEERYGRDPWFRQLVDLLTHYLEDPKFADNFTPTELREAVILAATRVESIRAYNRPFINVGLLIDPQRG